MHKMAKFLFSPIVVYVQKQPTKSRQLWIDGWKREAIIIWLGILKKKMALIMFEITLWIRSSFFFFLIVGPYCLALWVL